MLNVEDFKQQLFFIDKNSFHTKALEVFEFQYINNSVYKAYCDHLNKNPYNVAQADQIPFLPIEFFKNHAVVSSTNTTQKTFMSSGTTDTGRSKHHVKDLDFYEKVSKAIFKKHMGKLSDINLYALLPSYLEQGDSSLIFMVDKIIEEAASQSGYYLSQTALPASQTKKQILFGVTYALLEAEIVHANIGECIIMDTGGMKGRKKELTREEVINMLKEKYSQDTIWSEYGMTELTSQAYGKDGMLTFPDWVSVTIRDINDPFYYLKDEQKGGINIIDLANIDSCAFIETKDLGMKDANGYFQVLGRFDNSDIRGCSLLI